jgi:hypothetical protein
MFRFLLNQHQANLTYLDFVRCVCSHHGIAVCLQHLIYEVQVSQIGLMMIPQVPEHD